MKNSETKDFVAYEYLSLNIKIEKEPLYVDCYENFGWTLVNNTALIDNEDYYINNYNVNSKKVINLKFKRDRKINNKMELQSLQRKMESNLKEIERLEEEPTIKGTIKGIISGVIGTVFLVFSTLPPQQIINVFSGAIGTVGCILALFIYKREQRRIEKENISLIEEQYNTLYDNCERAKKLID